MLRTRSFVSLLVMLLSLLWAPEPAHAVSARTERRAERLVDRARRHVAQNTNEDRHAAIQDLEDATLLDPRRPEWDLMLARLYYQCGFYGLARHRFEKLEHYEPDDPDDRFGLGLAWRQDWLKYQLPQSRERAIVNFTEAARLDPHKPDAWIMLVPLLMEKSDPRAAWVAARHALDADPNRADAMVAEAYASFRLGNVAHADSAFAVAVPRLPRNVRLRYEDIAPVATERDTLHLSRMWPKDRAAYIKRFWRELDPDIATPENEAQLEYWSRVTHAYLLYYDARRGIWDQRGEIFARYGPPALQRFDDVGDTLNFGRLTQFPMNVLDWDYPDLGMHVRLQDRMLNGFYLPYIDMGILESTIIEPEPDPDSLARRYDLMGVSGGRGVFHRLPPGTRPIPVEGALARFEGSAGPRLVADFEAPGDPGDSLVATWVVRDSAQNELARASHTLVPSACLPTEAQVAEFDSSLPPGRYEVGISVVGPNGRRGVFRDSVTLRPAGTRLSLSDLVVTCGVPDAGTLDPHDPSVRIEPNPYAIIDVGTPLTAYFEIYHLQPDAEGLAHFEYQYTVRSLEHDERIWVQRLLAPRPLPPIPLSESREEQQVGGLRRQFVSIPLEAMPVGHYQLSIRVRDLIGAREATVARDFYLQKPMPPQTAGGVASGAINGSESQR